ncbi:hypothetical protein ABL78_4165 [Leptomonas seymouri]|uniref:Uncharacterized protein n=1 Tax=Leptomonas seymouri TaxID=5684 RepID=A0A0N1PDB2_LEPSE|nr:hypothetical protein ABL78_4165 [Leptomonas seymouri]|eukprot:KPI86748.1 hypothetical protein ABL78_4165 [Leptomonas seymouri]
MTAPSPSASSSGAPLRQQMPDIAARAFANFFQQAEDDNVVCAFGPDYFRGASAGAFGGFFLTASLGWYSFSRLKADQREVDFLSGLRRGQRNRHFSSWTILRGLRTQPMLTVGCLALAATSAMKCMKWYLAGCRCREFYQDDLEYAMLELQSRDDPKAAALMDAIAREAAAERTPISPSAIKGAAVAELHKLSNSSYASSSAAPTTSPSLSSSQAGASLQSLLKKHDPNPLGGGSAKLVHRHPSFWDGVAVAFLGSVMDCYLPQKPVQRYYFMHAGLW